MSFFDANQLKALNDAKNKVRAASHPLRQRLLSLIQEKGEVRVTDIYKALRLEQSVASLHLSILRKAGLVVTKRDGQNVLYSVNEASIKTLLKDCAVLIGINED